MKRTTQQFFFVFFPDSKKRLKDVLKQFRDGEFLLYKPEEVSYSGQFLVIFDVTLWKSFFHAVLI